MPYIVSISTGVPEETFLDNIADTADVQSLLCKLADFQHWRPAYPCSDLLVGIAESSSFAETFLVSAILTCYPERG